MKVRINGSRIYLPGMSDRELDRLIHDIAVRKARLEEELHHLVTERQHRLNTPGARRDAGW